MKTNRLAWIVALAAAVVAGYLVAAERGPNRGPAPIDERFVPASGDRTIEEHMARSRPHMIQVTGEPTMVLDPRDIVSCQPPWVIPSTPHGTYWIHVFINPEAADIIKSGKGTYPEGTIILKQKFLDAEAKQTEFYTGMHKREQGYNPALGDWEFFTLDKTGTKVTARGKIDSCMDCHANFKQTDFVSRKYLRETAGKSGTQTAP